MIDTKLLTFLTLLEEKSYTKTASKLYITQPAVTHHIKTLEKDYDITLFTNPKTFDLTKSGRMLLDYAKSLKQQEELLLANLQKQESFICNVGFTPTVKAVIPPAEEIVNNLGMVPMFNAYTESYDNIIDGLLSGRLDFAFVDNSFDSSDFESCLLTNLKVVLVGNPNGQYKNKDKLTKEALQVATMVLPSEDSGLYKCVISSLKSKNIRFKNNYTIQSNDIDLIKKLVILSDGISFMYYDSVKDDIESGKLKKFDIQNLQINQNIYIIYSKASRLDDSMQNFLDACLKLGR